MVKFSNAGDNDVQSMGGDGGAPDEETFESRAFTVEDNENANDLEDGGSASLKNKNESTMGWSSSEHAYLGSALDSACLEDASENFDEEIEIDDYENHALSKVCQNVFNLLKII